jgi:hypothetical protein
MFMIVNILRINKHGIDILQINGVDLLVVGK